MRTALSHFLRSVLAVVVVAALPAAGAERAYSSVAPPAPAAAPAERFVLDPGAAGAIRIELGPTAAAEIEAVKKANTDQFAKRLQIGVSRELPARALPKRGPTWIPVAGGAAAHWEIVSTGASALRIALAVESLPPAAQIRFAGAGDLGTVYGPFTAGQVLPLREAWWSPVLEGERAVLEVFVPEAGSAPDVRFGFAWVSHLFVSPASARLESLAKAAGACEVDLICRSATDAALASVGKAVARMTFSDGLGGGTFVCTGTLLNTTAGPLAPYFYSAAHCISTQASANTLTTHWFYDRTGCGTGDTSPNYVQTTGGATLLYADTTTDVLLLQLTQNPPGSAVYAGWDSAAVANGAAFTAVHHPAGDWKKVSLGSSGGFSGYGSAGDTHLIALWDSVATGVTEGGSSGSGIFTFANSQYLLRGGLHGGPSSCSATGTDLRDYYSRFDRAFTFISQYLSPPAAVRGDVNGDRKADLFWREAAPGVGLSWWTMNASVASGTNYHQVDPAWQIADVGDVDGDGKADVIWRRGSDGASYLWTLDGLGFKGFHDLGILSPAQWTLTGIADLDGDGKGDVVWRGTDGTVYGWLMNGGTIASQGVIGNPGTQWVIADLADMNGDGKADIVFRNTTDGGIYVYFMNGLALASGGFVGIVDPAAWTLVGVADFNGDGKGDFLWRNTSGDTWVWLMNGAAFQSAGGIGNPGAGWSVRSFGDFDGDGKADMIWRHTDGTTYMWKMNGASVTSYLPVANPGGTWQVVAP